jgi:hypothetical protein
LLTEPAAAGDCVFLVQAGINDSVFQMATIWTFHERDTGR